ncbi:unnamed protein product [Symbiodinium sp. CCMP2456]|nr:unnamed protein product [Symbiodinium sp. CCMP2456]
MTSSRARELAAELVLDRGLTLLARLGFRVFLEVSEQACFKKMRILTHPDKCSPERKARAEEAFKELDNLWEDFMLMPAGIFDNLRRTTRRSPREEALFQELRDPSPEAKAAPKAKRGPGRPRKNAPPPQEASSSEPSTGKRKRAEGDLVKEPLSRESIRSFMALRASRKAVLPSGYTLFETLGFFMLREADGYMKVAWRDNKLPGDYLGRRFSGVDHDADPAKEVDFFDVPRSHACTSAFAHCRLVKEICRRGIQGWVDVDVVNSVFSQFEANFQECPEVVKRYNRDRDGMIAAVREAYGCSKDVAKRLFIRLGFMGRMESWLEDFGLKKNEGPLEAELACFGQDMRNFGEALAAKHAHWFELFKGKKYPLGSFMSAIYFKLERQFLDRMIAAVPEPAKVLSYEHDGLGIQLNGLSEASLLAALHDLDPLLQAAIKPPHDPLKLAKEQFPEEEWEAASSLSFDVAELHRALLVTRRCMTAPMEDGDVIVPEGDNVFLQYLPDKGRWEAQKICDKGLQVGIGGWLSTSNAFLWFACTWSMQEIRQTWPWLVKDAQKYIACFEVLAQLALLQCTYARLRHRHQRFCLPEGHRQ